MSKTQSTSLGFSSLEEQLFPNIINVCVLRGACPCRCEHCPVGLTPPAQRPNRFGDGSMSPDLFGRLVEEVAQYPHATMRIHAVGEPILWTHLSEALRFTEQQGVRTWLFTSLVTGNKDLLTALARNCSIVEVSVNGWNREEYHRSKGIDAFDTVAANICYLRQAAASAGNPLRILVSRVQTENQESDAAFLRHWEASESVDEAFVRSFHSYNHLLPDRADTEKNLVDPCLVPWRRFNIDCDGTAVACFNQLFEGPDRPDHGILGSVAQAGIAAIWQGEKLGCMRRAQWNNDYDGCEFSSHLPCRQCDYRQSLFTNRATSDAQVQRLKGGSCE